MHICAGTLKLQQVTKCDVFETQCTVQLLVKHYISYTHCVSEKNVTLFIFVIT